MKAALLVLALSAPALALASAPCARAQDAMAMPGMTMPVAPKSPPPAAAAPKAAPTASATAPVPDMAGMAPPQAMPGMEMAGMDMGGMAMMKGALGAYPMTREASGTAWQPDSTPMEGLQGRFGGWTTMVHGYATLVYDDQGGPRGDMKTFVESMLMGMAQRDLMGGTLTLRGMVSADPFMGKSGYPLLLQTGETADGVTALVDRQHPHDAVMELVGAYSRPIAKDTSAFLYVGWPGEPALGPATFMHRFSGMANPEAPLTHHWLDSTHITFGVVTAGIVHGPFKLEGSRFTGREPNQHRWDFDHPRFDSWSARLSFAPTRDLVMQVSYGDLHSPEQLTPDVNQRRTTASATYNRAYTRGDWQTSFAWGRDVNGPGRTLDAFLLDSAASLDRHTVFGRVENADKDELFDDEEANPLSGRSFNVSKFSLGYFYTVPVPRWAAADFGGLVSAYDLPSALTPAYGASPTSFMLFTRVKLR